MFEEDPFPEIHFGLEESSLPCHTVPESTEPVPSLHSLPTTLWNPTEDQALSYLDKASKTIPVEQDQNKGLCRSSVDLDPCGNNTNIFFPDVGGQIYGSASSVERNNNENILPKELQYFHVSNSMLTQPSNSTHMEKGSSLDNSNLLVNGLGENGSPTTRSSVIEIQGLDHMGVLTKEDFEQVAVRLSKAVPVEKVAESFSRISPAGVLSDTIEEEEKKRRYTYWFNRFKKLLGTSLKNELNLKLLLAVKEELHCDLEKQNPKNEDGGKTKLGKIMEKRRICAKTAIVKRKGSCETFTKSQIPGNEKTKLEKTREQSRIRSRLARAKKKELFESLKRKTLMSEMEQIKLYKQIGHLKNCLEKVKECEATHKCVFRPLDHEVLEVFSDI